MTRNIPIITFLQRTWMLLVFTVLCNFLTLWNHVFVWVPNGRDEWGNVAWRGLTLLDLCGAVLLVPALASAVVWTALLFIHLYFRDTLDKDVHDGTYLKDWREIGPVHRVWVRNLILIGSIIGFCILCSSLAKG